MINQIQQLGVVVCKDFNSNYPIIHDCLYRNGNFQQSRNGDTREFLDFNTKITKPLARCVAGYERDINVFFLIAEALWIFAGKRDVETLDIFNSRLKDFSDDGKNYHAPYGWRLRRWGLDSMQHFTDSNKHEISNSTDQVLAAVKMLKANPEDRRVVLSIWNPDLDLNKKSNDLPCNDLVMLKIRNNGLHLTISNRSNDLNLGLPTNVFQFSILGEIISQILGIDYKQQNHNSDSLHIYLNQEVSGRFQAAIIHHRFPFNLYGVAKPTTFDFNFDCTNDLVVERLFQVDGNIHYLFQQLSTLKTLFTEQRINEAGILINDTTVKLDTFSKTLSYYFNLLAVYVGYKLFHKDHMMAITHIIENAKTFNKIDADVTILALNFFFKRLAAKDRSIFNTAIDRIQKMDFRYKNIPFGNL